MLEIAPKLARLESTRGQLTISAGSRMDRDHQTLLAPLLQELQQLIQLQRKFLLVQRNGHFKRSTVIRVSLREALIKQYEAVAYEARHALSSWHTQTAPEKYIHSILIVIVRPLLIVTDRFNTLHWPQRAAVIRDDHHQCRRTYLALKDDLSSTTSTAVLADEISLRSSRKFRRKTLSRDSETAVSIPHPEEKAGDRGATTVWFATDRAPADKSVTPHIQTFNDSRGDGRLSYGTAEISFPADHKFGKIERPTFWKLQFAEDQSKHVLITKCATETLTDWTASANKLLDNLKSRVALVFIHGFNVGFDDAIRRAAQIGFDIDLRGLITCFSWSSEASLLKYTADRENSTLAAPQLAHFLCTLREQLKVTQVHIIAHSMGNQVLIGALEHLKKTESRHLREIVMAAPDVGQEIFNQVWSKLKPKAKRYTIYGSNRDRALLISKTKHSAHPRLGDGGTEVYVIDGVDTIDASKVSLSIFDARHSYTFDSRQVLTDLHYVIRTSTPANQRAGLMPRSSPKNLTYWELIK